MKFVIFFALLLVGFSLQQTTPATTPASTPSTTPVAGTAGTAGTSGAVTEQCEYPPLLGDVPSLFNVFVFENFNGFNSDLQGRLAAGGDVTLEAYSVASGLPLVVCPATSGGTPSGTTPAGTTPAGTTPAGTSVSSTSSSSSGTEWFDNLVAGGMVTWSNGALTSGNIVVGKPSQIGPAVSNGLKPPCGVVTNASRIDFAFWQTYETDLSQKLANVGQDNKVNATLDANNILTIPLDIKALESGSGSNTNGNTASTETNANLGTSGSEEESTEDKIQVIVVNAADLLVANTVTYQGAGSTPSTTPAGTTPVATTPVATTPQASSPAGTSVTPSGTSGTGESGANKTVLVFNVYGSPCGFQSAGLQALEPYSKKIIWNFIDCTNMTIQNVRVPGTILAPHAVVNGNSGVLDGQLIATSFNGSLQFLNTLFEGCVDLGNVTAGTAGTQGTAVGGGTQAGTAVQPTAQGTAPTVAARNVQARWWGLDEEHEDENRHSSSSALATAIAPLVALVYFFVM